MVFFGHRSNDRLARMLHLKGAIREDMRELEAWSCHTYLLSKDSKLGKELLLAMQIWKSKAPASGPHPVGAPRWTVASPAERGRRPSTNYQVLSIPWLSFEPSWHGTISAVGSCQRNS